MRYTLVTAATVSALVLASLSGCSLWRNTVNYIRSDSADVCPDATILANTAVLPAFDPAKGADPSNVLYTVSMINLKTRCDYSKRSFEADSNLKVFFHATRPPGGEEAHYRVPYYVAITTNGVIQDKQVHWLSFAFPKAVSAVDVEDDIDSTLIKVDRTKKSYEYHLVLGFQLTKAQLDYNKTMGRYEP